MTTTTTLSGADLASVVRLLSRSIHEIPLYRWTLGEHLADQALREWLSEILVRPLLNAGCVLGAHHAGRLTGVLVWQPHDVDLAPDGHPPLTPDDFASVAAIPGLRERLVTLLTSPQLPAPVDDAVNCRIAAVLPDERGGDALVDLMQTVERFCTTTRRPYYAWTGSDRLRDWFVNGWGATEFASQNWNGLEMYGVVSARLSPDTPPRHPLRRRASAS